MHCEQLGTLERLRLVDAYTRRKQWEASILAIEVWDLLGRAMMKPNGNGNVSTEKVSAGKFLAIAGQRI